VDEPCRLLCHHGAMAVLSVDYRLAPEHPFPAALVDATAALRWAQEHASDLGVDPDRIAIGGDSAGGNLAAVVSQRTRAEAPPTAQLLVYPPTDRPSPRASHRLFDGYLLSMADRAAFHSTYTGDAVPADDPRVSPLYASDLSGLPPALVVTAGFDVLRDEGEAYARALRDVGTVCELHREPSLPHGFLQLTSISRAAHHATIEVAGRFGRLLRATGGARA